MRSMKEIILILLGCSLLCLFSCGDDEGNGNEPELIGLSLQDGECTELDDENANLEVVARLESPALSNVVFNYSTLDGTAAAGIDFESIQNAQLVIPEGQQEAAINISVFGDEFDEGNETFRIVATNVSNAQLVDGEAIGTIIDDDADTGPLPLVIPDSGYTSPDSYEGMELVWSDEFQAASVDQSAWTFETGTGNGGWGNNELQYYTEENTYMAEDDFLVIEAKEESIGGNSYTSSRLITQGKKSFQYGRIDVRAALPKGQGIWPAIWMLGDNFSSDGWPQCGEIDIMELLGHQTNRIYGSLHYRNESQHAFTTASQAITGAPDFHEEFHVFSIDWQEDQMRFLVDDLEYASYATNELSDEENPFNNSFFFILNVAVGGEWPGSPDQSTAFPQRMIVDYVRVFQ